jgi:hypothetical protein
VPAPALKNLAEDDRSRLREEHAMKLTVRRPGRLRKWDS